MLGHRYAICRIRLPAHSYRYRDLKLNHQLQLRTMASNLNLPATMKAIQIQKTGGIDVIELRDVPVPVPKENEVLIKVEYAGINYIDTYFRSGLYPVPLPFTLGQEASGRLLSLPSSAAILDSEDYKRRGYALGDRIAAYSGGSLAEYVAVPWAVTAKLPDAVDSRTAAAVVVGGLTALTAIREAYEVKKGDWVLVHAAAGGLGLALCQLASQAGAHVIGTTSSPEKAALAKENGAEHVILYTKQNIVDSVLELTNGEGVHGIFDGVGKDTWEDNFKVARRKGTIVSIGNASGAVPPFAPLKLSPKNLKLVRPNMGNYVTTAQEMDTFAGELFNLVSRGAFKVKIHGEYEFSAEGVQKAQEDITGRGTTGKLIVKVA